MANNGEQILGPKGDINMEVPPNLVSGDKANENCAYCGGPIMPGHPSYTGTNGKKYDSISCMNADQQGETPNKVAAPLNSMQGNMMPGS